MYEVRDTISELSLGHQGKRRLVYGFPRAVAMETYSKPELIRMGVVGIYEPEPCTCDSCKKRRTHDYDRE